MRTYILFTLELQVNLDSSPDYDTSLRPGPWFSRCAKPKRALARPQLPSESIMIAVAKAQDT